MNPTQSVCKRILFVDDHEVLARLSVEIMEMNGYGAESASTAAEAIQKAQSGAFDVVVSDCKLNDMSGLQLAKRLPSMPFIIFSGYAPVECKDNVVASLSKEDLFPALLEKLKKLLAEPVAAPSSTGEPPKVEEIAWQFIAHVFPSMDRQQAQRFIEQGAAILCPYFPPASQTPTEEFNQHWAALLAFLDKRCGHMSVCPWPSVEFLREVLGKAGK